ncbi:MAG: hypothetical protein IKP52_02860 [Prevotella sp.]|nr:hypothetical protein [Prevotella sp.]
MQENLKVLLTLLIMSSFLSCANDNEIEDNATPASHQIYLRFVSPIGTNVLDSLHVLENDVIGKELDDNLLSISINRTSDNQSFGKFDMKKYLYRASPQHGTEFEKEETLVDLGWCDFNIWDIEKRPYKYHEIYIITMISPKIFGDKKLHTLNWYVNVAGRTYDAYKCEYDYEEISLDNDPLYNKRVYDGRHMVLAIITIVCK